MSRRGKLRGVLGMRVKLAEIEIFEDYEVATRVQTGEW